MVYFSLIVCALNILNLSSAKSWLLGIWIWYLLFYKGIQRDHNELTQCMQYSNQALLGGQGFFKS